MNMKVLRIRGRGLVGFHRGSEQVSFKTRLRDTMQKSCTQQRFSAASEFFHFISFFGEEVHCLCRVTKTNIVQPCQHIQCMHTIQDINYLVLFWCVPYGLISYSVSCISHWNHTNILIIGNKLTLCWKMAPASTTRSESIHLSVIWLLTFIHLIFIMERLKLVLPCLLISVLGHRRIKDKQ